MVQFGHTDLHVIILPPPHIDQNKAILVIT